MYDESGRLRAPWDANDGLDGAAQLTMSQPASTRLDCWGMDRQRWRSKETAKAEQRTLGRSGANSGIGMALY